MIEDTIKVDGFEWIELFRIVRKRIKIILVVTVVAAVIGLIISSKIMSPVYRADATLIVNAGENATITNYQISSADSLVDIYSAIIESDTVMEKVITDLNLNMDYEQLKDMLTIKSVDSTAVMKISVDDKDSEEALKILTDIVEIVPDMSDLTVEVGSVNVISNPRLEKDPVSPNIPRNTVVAGLLGLVISVLVILIKELKSNTIKEKDDIVQKLKESVLGVVPAAGLARKVVNQLSEEKRLIPNKTLLSDASAFDYKEAYNSVKTNLNILASSNEYKSIIVTSSIKGEGKSTVSINLAMSLAAGGKKVVLVECDLRQPKVLQYINGSLEEKNGLSDFLVGNCSANEIMIRYNKVYIVPAGKRVEYPIELLGSKRMKSFMSGLKNIADYIIVDTPPVGELADAVVLSTLADAAIMVVGQNKADLRMIRNAKENLEKSGIHLMGMILNNYTVKHGSGYSYGYRYGYKYYYDDSSNKKQKKNRKKSGQSK